ncbi:MAG: Transposase domain [Rickettsiaceae bacterium]|jgi:hypothetical protein|nr:Transposase domain [Rickettsiaceae bacterium]
MSIKITKGNKSDISVLTDLTKGLKGKIYGDNGILKRSLEQAF